MNGDLRVAIDNHHIHLTSLRINDVPRSSVVVMGSPEMALTSSLVKPFENPLQLFVSDDAFNRLSPVLLTPHPLSLHLLLDSYLH
jgi:hypothetical protein